MRRGVPALVLAGALAALFVSATRSLSRSAATSLVIVAGQVSCRNPPAVLLPDCVEVRKEEKALEEEVRAHGRINSLVILPGRPYLVVQPGTGRR